MKKYRSKCVKGEFHGPTLFCLRDLLVSNHNMWTLQLSLETPGFSFVGL